MCKRFDHNKEKFVTLVYEMKMFSEQQITQVFYGRNNEIIIDEHASIRDVLDNLKEIGSLQYDGLNYKLVSDEERMSFNPFSFHVLA
jgi:hypothetical protein